MASSADKSGSKRIGCAVQASYLAAFYSVDGQMVRHADMAKYCVLYTLICLLGLATSVPYWQFLGLL